MKRLLFYISLVLVIVPNIRIMAQGNPNPVLKPGMLIVAAGDSDYWLLNSQTGEQTPLFSTQFSITTPLRIFAADSHTQTIYAGQDDPNSRMVAVSKIDMATGTSELLIERANLSGFILSPDNALALVVFYQNLSGRVPMLMCVLDIQTKLCTDVKLPMGNAFWFHWVSNDEFLFIAYHQVYSAKADDNFVLHLLPEIPSVSDFTTIPNTNQVLFTMYPQAGLFIYDLDTRKISPYSLTISQPDISGYGGAQFSPNGMYLITDMEQRTPQEGYDQQVYDFKQGSFISQLPNYLTYSATYWLPDNRHVVGLYFKIIGQYPAEILMYDVETEQQVLLFSYDGLLSFVVVQ